MVAFRTYSFGNTRLSLLSRSMLSPILLPPRPSYFLLFLPPFLLAVSLFLAGVLFSAKRIIFQTSSVRRGLSPSPTRLIIAWFPIFFSSVFFASAGLGQESSVFFFKRTFYLVSFAAVAHQHSIGPLTRPFSYIFISA